LGGWDGLINRASTTWRTLLPTRKNPHSDAEWQLLLVEYPQLIKRPVTLTADGVVSVGFKDAAYKKRFGV
jgi:arsenate reductase-like glutaredoxin family protein